MKVEGIKIMRGSLLGTFSNAKASAVPRYLNGYPFSSANIVCRACDLNLFLTVFSYQRTFIPVLLVDVMNKNVAAGWSVANIRVIQYSADANVIFYVLRKGML